MSPSPSQAIWQVADLDGLPDNGNRYEIIGGELHMTRAPRFEHQDVAGAIYAELRTWSKASGMGQAVFNPGVILTEVDAVIPDVAWVSHERLEVILDKAGHLAGAPELIVEVLSQSDQDKKRDRVTKPKLYSIHGVQEYWVADPVLKLIEVWRWEAGVLQKSMTLYPQDILTSPLLRGFEVQVTEFFG